ncbi:MAG TPA: ligase-associated DNA damage response endonuclease PdeM [Parachlamydiaceae bacterium]|nr:ligase-associated DNA damage response endonuclease PdeM [Parachlamydiaceae bacterium]
MKLTIRNQTCHLLAEKAVFWEEEKAVILADIHIGKGTVFRKAGIPIPQGIMDDDLRSIARLIVDTKAEKCIIVGDLIHALSGLSDSVKKIFEGWLQSVECEVHLVLGNHDYALLKNLPAEWSLHIHKEALLIEPFYFSHFPTYHEKWFVWSGHLHPKVEISNGYDRLVLRCFQIFKDMAIIPAFGFFVGGTMVRKSQECKIYVIADESVIEI